MSKLPKILVLIVAMALAPQSFAQRQGTKLFEHLRTWFPAGTEVVYVSNLPFHGISSKTMEDLSYYAKLVALPAGFAEENPAIRPLADIDVISGVYIARRFRIIEAHKGLGLAAMLDGCSFLSVSEPGARSAIVGFGNRALVSVYGVPIYRPDPSTTEITPFAAIPEPGLLMICTDAGLAQDVLEQKARASSEVAFRGVEPLWMAAQTDAVAWGLRQFLPNKRDLTSPLNNGLCLMRGYQDQGSVGMTFALQPNSLATVTYVSTTQNAASIYEQSWRTHAVSTTQNGKQIVTMEFKLPGDNGELALQVMCTLFGLAVAI